MCVCVFLYVGGGTDSLILPILNSNKNPFILFNNSFAKIQLTKQAENHSGIIHQIEVNSGTKRTLA